MRVMMLTMVVALAGACAADDGVLPLLSEDGLMRGTAFPAAGELRLTEGDAVLADIDGVEADVVHGFATVDETIEPGMTVIVYDADDLVVDTLVVGDADDVVGLSEDAGNTSFSACKGFCPSCIVN